MNLNSRCPKCLRNSVGFTSKVKAKYLQTSIKCPDCGSALNVRYRLREKIIVGVGTTVALSLGLFHFLWLVLTGRSLHYLWLLAAALVLVEILHVGSTKFERKE
jgi:hypothetical protein